MGVIGLDLSIQCLGGMPRKLGWPRRASAPARVKKSKYQINANHDALIAEAEAIANGSAHPVLA